MKQDIIKFNFKLKSDDFFVNDKNIFAYNLVKNWPNWDNQFAYIYGSEKCGKTFITKIWKEKSNAIFLNSDNFLEKLGDNLDINYIRENNWILDDVDKLINDNKGLIRVKILNFINIIKTAPHSYLLMTGKCSPKQIACELKDLTSRMLASVVIEVKNPDEKLLCLIIQKYLKDRNVILQEKCFSYISDRIERTYEYALTLAKKIDSESLKTKSNISIYFLKSLFEKKL